MVVEEPVGPKPYHEKVEAALAKEKVEKKAEKDAEDKSKMDKNGIIKKPV